MARQQAEEQQRRRRAVSAHGDGIALRRVPAPYKAMVAICSDLDGTPDAAVYGEIMRFLNTTADTSMGVGAGLEVGNSIYFDVRPTQFSYWSTDETGRAMAVALMRSGHIDCLHSYGELATTRAHVERALGELGRRGCRLEVWVDHATAPTNLGADIMRGSGDVQGAPPYHADLTLAHGVRFVWRGRLTSLVAQDVPRGSCLSHPDASARTRATEAAKRALGRAGSRRYRPHASNRVLWPARLRDGSDVLEFMRTNWHPRGISVGDTATGLAEVLDDRVLDTLARCGGISVLYTHIGKVRDVNRPLDEATCMALRALGRRDQAGEILVTTTRRLLGYVHARTTVRWAARRENGMTVASVVSNGLPAQDLDGLTFEADLPIGRIEVDGACVVAGNGSHRLSIPWRRLSFPEW